MNRLLMVVCMLLWFSLANASQVYQLHMIVYANDTVQLVNITIRDGEPDIFPSAGEDNYAFKIISTKNKTLYDQPFQMGFVAYRLIPRNSTVPDEVLLEKREELWRLPYFDDAATIQLFHENKKIFEYQLPQQQKPAAPPSPDWTICCIAAGVMALAVAAFLLFKKFNKPSKSGGQK